MKLDLSKEKLEHLLRRGRDTAVLAGAAALEGAELARCRAESAVEYARLAKMVRELQQEIDLQLRHIGQLIYATHTGTPSASEDIQTILEFVDSLYDQMAAHQEEMSRLKKPANQ